MRRSLGRVQRLEDRRLLAADLSVIDLAPVESFEPEICQVAEQETTGDVVDQSEALDLDATEVQVDSQAEIDNEVADQVESSVQDLGDPVDGTDGFFGTIDAENPSQTFSFSPTEDGVIDVVVASSFGDAETRLQVTDSNGDVVASTTTEELSGFQILSFEAEAGEAFELTVGSEEGAEGYFQVTVDHNEIPEPTDFHVDTIGEDSTLLEFVDGAASLSGELELAGDVDTFQFTAESGGKASLGLAELNAENATELQVQVFGADGEAITRGITNETVGISFDVENGGEYFLAISAGEGEVGEYQLDLSLEAGVVEVEVEVVDDESNNESEVDESDVVEDVVDGTTDSDTEVVVDGTQIDSSAGEGELDACEAEPADEPVVDSVVVDEPVISETDIDEVVDTPIDVVETQDDLVLFDSFDDVPNSVEVTETESDALDPADEIDSIDFVEGSIGADLDEAVDGGSFDDLIDDEVEICFSDLDSGHDVVDSFFAEFDPQSIFRAYHGFGSRR